MALHHLVRSAAQRRGNAVALRFDADEVTYTQLDELANKIGQRLLRDGVKAKDRVAIWLAKSPAAIATMQAVLRIGAAYVPIDPNSPIARAHTILSDCDVSVVVTTDGRAEAATLNELGISNLRLSEGLECQVEAFENVPQAEMPHVETAGSDVAYILYTSGSTGTPKGVCITHDNALAYVNWAVKALDLTAHDRLANHAPLHFDLSVLDLYAAFHAGASVQLISDDMAFSAAALIDEIRRNNLTVWYSVPSVLILMIEMGLLEEADISLRAILFAGEVFPLPYLRRLRSRWPDIRLLNLYGPTETNACACYEVTTIDARRTAPVPIGRATSGNTLWAVRASGEVALAGQEGELLVSGPTVTPGYFGHPKMGNAPYATGDVVRVVEDGLFEYVGRRDHMVKVRGHRIELGEIEACLCDHPDVLEAVVLVQGVGLKARLVAFITTRNDANPQLIELKAHCAKQVPRYMIIDSVRHVLEFQRTSTGKVDRRHLERLMNVPKANSGDATNRNVKLEDG